MNFRTALMLAAATTLTATIAQAAILSGARAEEASATGKAANALPKPVQR